MQDRMLGVVLWKNDSDTTAVVWCEDHGNLAYFNADDSSVHDGFALDAGDLIQFEMREDPDCRRVNNPQRVDCGFAPSLVDSLRNDTRAPVSRVGNTGAVVRFPEARH